MRKTLLCAIVTLAILFSVAPAQAKDSFPSNKIHIVQPGDTLFSIARWYGVDMQAIVQANALVNPSHIYVGQRLIIPTSTSSSARVYVVRAGDTLLSIANAYGIGVWALAQANGIYNLNHIYIGQRLVIPGVSPPSTSPPSTSSVVWRGEYYAGTSLEGGPIFVRDDRAVNFHWGLKSPDTRLNTDQFSVHWTRTINFRGGLYRFMVTVDDGVRLWVDGALVLDAWKVQTETAYEVDVTLTPGKHVVAIDYFEDTGNATIQFSFRRLGDAPVAVTPTPTPVVGPTPTTGPVVSANGWVGEYFGNVNLEGAPVVTRIDPDIGFDWKLDSPASGIPENYFSVRWQRTASFKSDNYGLCAMADDGVRLYLDGELVLDEWHGSYAQSYCVEVDMTAGEHNVMVEYYEDGGNALIYVWWERH